MLLLILAFLFVSSSLGRPSHFAPYHGFADLRPSSSGSQQINNGVHKHGFSHKDERGRIINFEYKAVLSDRHNVIFLDEEMDIHSVSCLGKNIEITFSGNEIDHQKYLGENTIYTGGIEWGCKANDGTASIILHRFVRLVSKSNNNNKLVVEVVPSSYHEVFQNVDVTFETNKFPKDHWRETALKPEHQQDLRPQSSDPSMKRGWLSSLTSFLGRVWESVKSFGDNVVKIIHGIETVTKALVEGNYNDTQSLRWEIASWNFDPVSRSARDKSIKDDSGIFTCTNCYANVDVTFVLGLRINSYQLKMFRAVATGNAAYNIEGKATLSTSVDSSWNKVIATVTSGPLILNVAGVPVVLNAVIPISFGYELHAEASLSLSIASSASASLSYGVQYTDEGGLEWIYDNDFKKNGSLVDITPELTITVGAMLYISPTIVLQIQFLGGPNFGIRPFLELAATTGSPTCEGALQVSLNWGMQLTVGATLHVSFASIVLYDKSTDPFPVYNQKWTISSHCFSLSAKRRDVPLLSSSSLSAPSSIFVPVQFITGTTWAGDEIYAKNCSVVGDGILVEKSRVSYQLLGYNTERGFGWFLGSGLTILRTNKITAKCHSQAIFKATTRQQPISPGKSNLLISFQITEERPELKYMIYSRCDNPAVEYYFRGGEYIVSDGWSRFDLPPADCYTGSLSKINSR